MAPSASLQAVCATKITFFIFLKSFSKSVSCLRRAGVIPWMGSHWTVSKQNAFLYFFVLFCF